MARCNTFVAITASVMATMNWSPLSVKVNNVGKTLEGRWIVTQVRLYLKGEVEEIKIGKPISAVVNNQRIVIREGKERRFEWQFEIDATKGPKWLTFANAIEDQDGKKQPLKCIYSISGDRVEVCLHFAVIPSTGQPCFPAGLPRPTRFRSKTMPMYCVTLKRQ